MVSDPAPIDLVLLALARAGVPIDEAARRSGVAVDEAHVCLDRVTRLLAPRPAAALPRAS
jgi:hypothetical protein